MNIQKLIETFKVMGLCSQERQKCLETYRDCGTAEAMEHARLIVHRNKIELSAAKAAMDSILGV